jgi:hypothetical protein
LVNNKHGRKNIKMDFEEVGCGHGPD